ncbi:MAG: hypothetical protein V1846_05650 [Candidatus Komeilibacteria bacterium]
MPPINAPIERLSEGSRYRTWFVFLLLIVVIGLVVIYFIWFGWGGQKQQTRDQNVVPTMTIFAYVREVQPNDQGAYIAVDPAEWFTGQEAVEAAQADNKCPGQSTSTPCSLTNGYYIRNSETTTQPLVVSSVAMAEMQTLSTGSDGNNLWDQPITLNQWLNLFASSTKRDWKQTPFIFSLIRGKVTAIREQYIP